MDPTQLAQYALNGLVIGSILTLAAVALTLVYGILNIANFAHGDLLTLGAYVAFFGVVLLPDADLHRYTIVLAALLAAVAVTDRLLRPRLVPRLPDPWREHVDAEPMLDDREASTLFLAAAVMGALLAGVRWGTPMGWGWTVVALEIALVVPALPTLARWLASDGARRTVVVTAITGSAMILLLHQLVLPAIPTMPPRGLALSWTYALATAPLTTALLLGHPRLRDDRGVQVGLVLALLLGAFLVAAEVLLGAFLSIVAVAAFAMLMDVLVWRPMRKQEAGLLTLIIISIGLALVVRHLVSIRWGTSLRTFPGTVTQAEPLLGSALIITDTKLLVMAVALVVMVLVHVLLQHTRIGKAMRALADNPDLARITGIDVDRVILYVWALSGGLAALAGILIGQIVPIRPLLGWNYLLPIFAAVILGGIGSAYGAMLGALIIGLAMETAPAFGISTGYKLSVAFAALIITLLVRPQGIAGVKRS